MREAILDIKEITHSREMYEAKPRPFVSAFIYICLLILILALTYTYFAQIDIVAKGNGIVRPNDNISTIRTSTQGELVDILVEEGSIVEEGDILYVLRNDNLQLQYDNYTVEMNEEAVKVVGLKQLMSSIDKGENLVTNSDYYANKYEQYSTTLNYMKHQNKSNELQLEQAAQSDRTGAIVNTLSNELSELRALKDSIGQGELTSDKSSVKNNYASYVNGFQLSELNYNQQVIAYQRAIELLSGGIISQKEFEDIEKAYFDAEIAKDQYQNNYLANLESQIDNTYSSYQLKSMEHESAILASTRLDNEVAYHIISAEKYAIDTIISIEDDLIAAERRILELKKNRELVALEIEKTIITSPTRGTINILTTTAKGDYISSGIDLASIIPADEAKFKVQIMLPNEEVANIHLGDEVKFNFHALPYKEYGYLRGVISSIGSDVVSSSNVLGYYLVEAELLDHTVISKKGEAKNIKVGMTNEAHIIIDEKSILNWLLEKLDLKE